MQESTLVICRKNFLTWNWCFKYSGSTLNASTISLEFLTHIVEQSKLTKSHLWGLKLKESAFSIPRRWIQIQNRKLDFFFAIFVDSQRIYSPFKMGRYSGHMNALPAYAASTCSQAPASWQTGPSSRRLSKEQLEVVPKVQMTQNGISPLARSSAMAWLSVSPAGPSKKF